MASRSRRPPREANLRPLRAGDWVFLSGAILGVRDATLIRLCDRGVAPLVDLRGAALLHTAPNVRRVGDRYEPISVGTTTSTRMNRFTAPLLQRHGVRAIVGKAGCSRIAWRRCGRTAPCT